MEEALVTGASASAGGDGRVSQPIRRGQRGQNSNPTTPTPSTPVQPAETTEGRGARSSPGVRRGRDFQLSPPREEQLADLTQQMLSMGQVITELTSQIQKLELKNTNLEATLIEIMSGSGERTFV